MNAAAELGRNPVVSKHPIQPEYLYYRDEQAGAGRDCRTRLARQNSLARTGTVTGQGKMLTYILLAMVEAP